MSMNGLVNETPKHCKGCFYRGGTGFGVSYCCYSDITGKLRNCPAEECPYYTAKKKKRSQISTKG